ncbi:hypothetical protein NHQ30_002806 [Ciborinia camelliae]|nr:hypothetical protein NHQ30_002806 [Ciborinia camelliae]
MHFSRFSMAFVATLATISISAPVPNVGNAMSKREEDIYPLYEIFTISSDISEKTKREEDIYLSYGMFTTASDVANKAKREEDICPPYEMFTTSSDSAKAKREEDIYPPYGIFITATDAEKSEREEDKSIPQLEDKLTPALVTSPNCRDSTPIAKLLNERFTEKDGYRDLKLVNGVDEYDDSGAQFLRRAILRWIINDVYETALGKEDGSREYFKTTRGGGEAAVLEDLKVHWASLRERMVSDDGKSEPTYIDFYDAAHVKWIRAASEEKLAKLMALYEDDTFIKLMNKVEPWSQG